VGDGGVAGTNSSLEEMAGGRGGRPQAHRDTGEGEDEILERRAFINSLF